MQLPLAAQQPVAQLTASQTQAPATQCFPLAHALPAPHPQLPFPLQTSAVTASQAVQAPPIFPQRAAVVAMMQVLPEQQPAQFPALHPVH